MCVIAAVTVVLEKSKQICQDCFICVFLTFIFFVLCTVLLYYQSNSRCFQCAAGSSVVEG